RKPAARNAPWPGGGPDSRFSYIFAYSRDSFSMNPEGRRRIVDAQLWSDTSALGKFRWRLRSRRGPWQKWRPRQPAENPAGGGTKTFWIRKERRGSVEAQDHRLACGRNWGDLAGCMFGGPWPIGSGG